MGRWYLRVEAVNLAHVVADTYDISTIRGGSFMLLAAIRSLEKHFASRLSPISTAASQGLFSFDGACEDPQALRHKVLAYLNGLTEHHATFAAAVAPENGCDFEATMQVLEADIHRQQWRRPTVAIPAFESTQAECSLDGWRPGVKPSDRPEHSPEERFSRSTNFRRQEGRELRQTIIAQVLGEGLEAHDYTADLEELSEDSAQGVLDGKMALIYIDGNSFGAIRRATCKTPPLRTDFDRRIQQCVRIPFLRDLVAHAEQDAAWKTKAGHVRLEVLMWGGDELMLIVPAWRAWHAIECFYRHARKLEFGHIPLTHRAAVVFCHHNAAILQIRELAEELLQHTRADLQERWRCELASSATEITPEIDAQIRHLSDHARGDGYHYLNLESFDMIRGSLSRFIAGYYRGVPYHRLLLRDGELGGLRDCLTVIRGSLARSRVMEIINILQEQPENVCEIEEIENHALELLPLQRRHELIEAIDTLTQQHEWRWRWYLVNDLWDYIPERRTP